MSDQDKDHDGAAVRGEAVAMTDVDRLRMPKREAFIEWAKERAFDVTESKDAWGNREFIHPHIESIWFGWFHAPSVTAPVSSRVADAPSEPSELPTTIRDGMHWPEGYVTDPNGKIIPPKGRFNDFEFGYNVGYGEGLASIKDTVANIGAKAVAKSRAADALDSQPTSDSGNAQLMRFYAVDTMQALIDAQEQHIAKLQAKLPRDTQPAFTSVREG